MEKLGLILGLSLLAGIGSLALSRGLASRPSAGEIDTWDLWTAIAQGTRLHSSRRRIRFSITIAVIALSIAALVVLGQRKVIGIGLSWQSALFAASSFGLGAIIAMATSSFGRWIGHVSIARMHCVILERANQNASMGAGPSLEGPLQLGLRGATSALLFIAFMALLTLGGAAAVADRIDRSSMTQAPALLVWFALGVSTASLLHAHANDALANASMSSGEVSDAESRHASTLARLICDEECIATLVFTTFETAIAFGIAAMMAAKLIADANAVVHGVAMHFILLPILAFGFAVVAAVIGVLAVKTDGHEPPRDALMRGFYVTSILVVLGHGSAIFWLFRAQWLWLVVALIVGVLTCYAFLLLSQYYFDAHYGPALVHARAIDSGTRATAMQRLRLVGGSAASGAILIGAAAFTSYRSGDMSGLPQGGLFGLLMAAIGLLGAAPFVAITGFVGLVSRASYRASLLVPPNEVPVLTTGTEVPSMARALMTLGHESLVLIDRYAGATTLAVVFLMLHSTSRVAQGSSTSVALLAFLAGMSAVVIMLWWILRGIGNATERWTISENHLCGVTDAGVVVETHDEPRRTITSGSMAEAFGIARVVIDSAGRSMANEAIAIAAGSIVVSPLIGFVFKTSIGGGAHGIVMANVTTAIASVILAWGVAALWLSPSKTDVAIATLASSCQRPLKLIALCALVAAPFFSG